MNEQGKRTFIDFLIQLIFIILFVIVLVWLFPTKDWLKESYFNTDGETYIEEKETTIDDETFIDNINNMLEGAKSYFGYEVNLPEEDESVEVTLGELVENHIIIMPKDKKGNKCDESSKATITKTLNGYAIKVELTCGKTTDYIIRNVGCNPFCENNCTEKCKLEYEYSKKINGYWTNWSNWSSWSTSKKVATETMKVETKKVTSKICPNGYSLNSEQTACVKTNTSEKVVDANINKTCPDGYELNQTNTLCVKKSSSTTIKKAEDIYTCKDGYTLTEDHMCVKSEASTTTTQANAYYTCPSGYSESGNGCYRILSIPASSSTKYSCGGGYSYTSGVCQKTVTNIGSSSGGANCSITYERVCTDSCKLVQKETCTYTTSPTKTTTYSCSSGTLSGSSCIIEDYASKQVSYSCSNGTLSGNVCITTVTKNNVIESEHSYKCTEGILEGENCIIGVDTEDTKEVEITYSCKEGTLKDTKCVITNKNQESTNYTLKEVTYYRYSTKKYVEETISYKWSTSKKDEKLINDGYKLTGKTRKNCS